MRIGVVNNGLHAEMAFASEPDVTLLYVGRFRGSRIWFYDVIVVPIHTDQIFLCRYKPLLTKYVEKGGVLVLFGAQKMDRQWAPWYLLEDKFTEDIELYRQSAEGRIVFSGIPDEKSVQYHNKYFGHGSIAVDNESEETLLAGDTHGRRVMLIRRFAGGGALFVTTLDPDYHSVTHVPGPTYEIVEKTHEKAHKLVQNILKWARDEAKRQPHRRMRLLQAIGGTLYSWTTEAFLYFLPLWSIGLYIIWSKPGLPLAGTPVAVGVLPGVIAFVGSVASIVGFFMTQRARRGKQHE